MSRVKITCGNLELLNTVVEVDRCDDIIVEIDELLDGIQCHRDELQREVNKLKAELLAAKMTIAGFEAGSGWRNIKETEELKVERNWWKKQALHLSDMLDATSPFLAYFRKHLENMSSEEGYE